MTLCFIDTETTGLSLEQHDVWEIAYAFDDDIVHSAVVPHSLANAEVEALEVNNYMERGAVGWRSEDNTFERELREQLRETQATVVGANPAFDMYRLRKRWHGEEPWHYRSIDIEAYAMPFLDLGLPRGLHFIAEALREHEATIPEPDHTAAGDVLCLRACFRTLQRLYEAQKAILAHP